MWQNAIQLMLNPLRYACIRAFESNNLISFNFISNLFHICGQKAKLQEILQFI